LPLPKTLEEVDHRDFYCVRCDAFVGSRGQNLDFRVRWRNAREHVLANPNHEVHDVMVDRSGGRGISNNPPTVLLLAGAISWDEKRKRSE
jgi:hypothetical protein